MNIYHLLLEMDTETVYELTYLGAVDAAMEDDISTIKKYLDVKDECVARHDFERAKQIRDGVYEAAHFSTIINELLK